MSSLVVLTFQFVFASQSTMPAGSQISGRANSADTRTNEHGLPHTYRLTYNVLGETLSLYTTTASAR